ncbi:MAG: CHAD domain-containing protein [Chloroflexota bacterium]
MLTPEERTRLESFVERSTPGTPYRRRARILLLSESGLPPETIAGQVGASITQTRNFLRAYQRQGLAIFPDRVLREPPPFSPDDLMSEVGRTLMAAQLPKIRSHETALRDEAEVTAVHETRKAIRRLNTAFQLFAPFFEEGALTGYQKRFRKVMRRLGRSRDGAIFLGRLATYLAETELPEADRAALLELQDYWQAQQAPADQELRHYVGRKRYAALLDDFTTFTETAGLLAQSPAQPYAPRLARHHIPIVIYQHVAAARAYGADLDVTELEHLHQLRIESKELRYTLQFFEPVLGPTAAEAIATVQAIQEQLGELNDARVALAMLHQTAGCQEGVAVYRPVVQARVTQLHESFPPVWAQFNDFAWRRDLATAVSVL